MKIIIFEKDVVEAVTPFLKGCAFKALINAHGDLGITYGCYCLTRLKTGFSEILCHQLEYSPDNTVWNLDFKPMPGIEEFELNGTLWEIKRRVMNMEPSCAYCGGVKKP